MELLFGVPALPIYRHARGRQGHGNAGGRRDKARPELAELIAVFHEICLIACSRSCFAQKFAICGDPLAVRWRSSRSVNA